jgi:sugar phosphate isomerase/epimerase
MNTFSRRTFVQRSLAGGALAVALPGISAADAARPHVSKSDPLKISIMSYAFHGLRRAGQMDVFGYLESSRYRYGLRAADIWNGFLDDTDDEYIKTIRAALDERELGLASLTVDGAHIWEDDAAMREQNHKNALASLKAASILQPRIVRIDAGAHTTSSGERNEDSWSNEAFDHIVSRYREYAQIAQDHGFKTCIENHWGPEKKWAELKRVYETVDSAGLGLACHLGSWSGTEEEVRMADREAAPWVEHTHIDWNTCTGPLLEERLGNLWKVGYEGYYSVEHHTGEDEYSEVAIQLALVRRQLEKFQADGVQMMG